METETHNPTEGIYAATDDYVHAIEVRDPSRFLFVAGTMGAEVNGAARVAALGGRVVPTTAIVAETLVSDWLIEVEVIAAG